AGRNGKVGTEHARIAEDAELRHAAMQRGVAAFRQPSRLGEHLRHHRPRLDTLHQKRSEVAVQRANVVLLPQPEAGTDDDGFLADAGIHPASYFALLDEHAQSLVKSAN